MAKHQPEKTIILAVSKKAHHDKSFVQVEEKLTEAQLEVIAGGGPETSP